MKILFSLALLFLNFLATAQSNWKKNPKVKDTLNVKSFGAAGDGVTNDYKALQKAFDYVNQKGHGIIFFPKGNYYIADYNDSLHPNLDLKFKNCVGIKIIGKNAKITINGNFTRKASYQRNSFSYSNINQITVFYFDNCRRVFMSGFEINGNVSQMKRDENVVEKGQGLITIMGSDSVTIQNVFVHHSPSDGIYIGARNKNSAEVTMSHVRSLNNARQGMSITGLTGGYFKSCTFSNTGFTGKYGFHRPAAGVDIEPHGLSGGSKTGNIVFERDTFENNIGGQFLCTSPAVTSNITLKNCKLTGIDSFSRYQVILAADSVVVENCEMTLGSGNIYPTWQTPAGSHVVIKNSTIKSSLQGILSTSKDNKDSVWILNNKLIFTGNSLSSYFPYLQTKNLIFSNNQVYIPSSAIKTKRFTSLIQNAILSEGNKFYSDQTSVKLKVAYDKTKQVTD